MLNEFDQISTPRVEYQNSFLSFDNHQANRQQREKMAAEKAELVFIPAPGMGHLPSTVEFAQRLVAQFPHQISITFMIMRFTSIDEKVDSFIQSLKTNSSTSSSSQNDDVDAQITYLELPFPENPPSMESKYFLRLILDAYKPIIKQTLLQKQQQQSVDFPTNKPCQRLAGFVLDMSCSTMIDVANELGLPSYIYFASGAPFLQIMLHFASFGVPDITPVLSEGQQSPVLEVAGLKNPLPLKVWPDMFLDKVGGWAETMLDIVKRYQETMGILVNTFAELEPHLIHSLTSSHNEEVSPSAPAIYPVGPIINMRDDSANNNDQKDMIMSWLDSQPPSSVVFLCFGSMAIFSEIQLKEIAAGLERSGHRFLWSLRQNTAWSHGSDGGGEEPESESEYFQRVLPEGFLTRTAGLGRVIGWAPQVSVLGHKAVGAFVSHCGWNSVLESLWFGVPLLTWPMYGEQQLNAFVLVYELGLAVEISIDYKCNFMGESDVVVGEEEIEKGIRKVMDAKEGGELREKVKGIGEMGRKALVEGEGSSYQSMGNFVEDVFKNLC